MGRAQQEPDDEDTPEPLSYGVCLALDPLNESAGLAGGWVTEGHLDSGDLALSRLGADGSR